MCVYMGDGGLGDWFRGYWKEGDGFSRMDMLGFVSTDRLGGLKWLERLAVFGTMSTTNGLVFGII